MGREQASIGEVWESSKSLWGRVKVKQARKICMGRERASREKEIVCGARSNRREQSVEAWMSDWAWGTVCWSCKFVEREATSLWAISVQEIVKRASALLWCEFLVPAANSWIPQQRDSCLTCTGASEARGVAWGTTWKRRVSHSLGWVGWGEESL